MRLAHGSLAARVAREELHGTKSHHHQGVERVGEGLEVTGWATIDELPEAIEVPGNRFSLGVQWHPEADETSPLVAALVDEARAYRAERLPAAGGRMTLAVLEPATEAVLAEIPRAGVEEADAAVARAKAAYPAWRAVVARPTARGCCTGSPTRWRPSRRSSRCSRPATPASRSATPAARWAWSSTRSASTPARSSARSATRSRSPAASR